MLTCILVIDSLYSSSSHLSTSSVGLLTEYQGFNPWVTRLILAQVSSDQIPLPSDGCQAANAK